MSPRPARPLVPQNAAYGRWDDARKVWGSIINNCRSLVRQANTFFEQDRYPGYGNFRDYRRRVAAETSAFTRCLRCFLRGKVDEPNLAVELKKIGFTPNEVAGYMAAGNRQCYALQKLGETAHGYGMNHMDRTRFDSTLSVLTDNVGACEVPSIGSLRPSTCPPIPPSHQPTSPPAHQPTSQSAYRPISLPSYRPTVLLSYQPPSLRASLTVPVPMFENDRPISLPACTLPSRCPCPWS